MKTICFTIQKYNVLIASNILIDISEKPFIALNDQLTQTVDVNAGQEEAKILVKYYAYPEPSFKW